MTIRGLTQEVALTAELPLDLIDRHKRVVAMLRDTKLVGEDVTLITEPNALYLQDQGSSVELCTLPSRLGRDALEIAANAIDYVNNNEPMRTEGYK